MRQLAVANGSMKRVGISECEQVLAHVQVRKGAVPAVNLLEKRVTALVAKATFAETEFLHF